MPNIDMGHPWENLVEDETLAHLRSKGLGPLVQAILDDKKGCLNRDGRINKYKIKVALGIGPRMVDDILECLYTELLALGYR